MISKELHILTHAELLFAEKGFEGTSTREIAKLAHVNVSMISYYFGSKEKLFEKIFQYRMGEAFSFAQDAAANDALDAWQKISLIVDRYSERLKNFRAFYLIVHREQIANQNAHIISFINDYKIGFRDIFKKLVEEGVLSGIFKKTVPAEFIQITITGILSAALHSAGLFKDSIKGAAGQEDNYFDDIRNHIKTILKYLLGYEETI